MINISENSLKLLKIRISCQKYTNNIEPTLERCFPCWAYSICIQEYEEIVGDQTEER
jgi:hypothetical protein